MFRPVPTYWLGLGDHACCFVDLLIHVHNPCAFTCLDQQVGPVHVSFKKKTPWSKDKKMSWSHWSLHIQNKDDLPSIHPRGLFYANWISIYTPNKVELRHRKEGLISLPSLCMFDRCIFHHSYTEWDRTLLHIDMTAPFGKWLSVQNSSASRFAHKTGAQWTCDWRNPRHYYHHSYYHWLNHWWKASPNTGILNRRKNMGLFLAS